MEDDNDLALLIPLREFTKSLVDTCVDVSLLDLVYKLLLNG